MTDTTKQIEQALNEAYPVAASSLGEVEGRAIEMRGFRKGFAAALVARATPVSSAPDQIETAAKAIYRLFDLADIHPWVERGNSEMQTTARRYARAALEAAPAKPQSDLHSTINMTVADAMRIVKANHGDFAEIERAFTANAAAELVAASVGAQVAGEPIYQCRITPTHPWTDCRDLLPPVGSKVLIHLGSRDEWVEHTVVGYYVWGALSHQVKEDQRNVHRVFVRAVDADGYLNARLLSDVRPTAIQQAGKGGA